MKLLDLTLPSPAENLACDEALLDECEAGAAEEVLRFWESPTPFVVVGYANQVAREVNVAACAARGIPILRRCSGGGTVVQGPGCLNYALVLQITEDGPTRNISAANHFIMERNRAAIAPLNSQLSSLNFSVSGHTDLTVNGLKFSGNSQRRRRQYLLFHGTLLLNFGLKLIGELLPVPAQQPEYRKRRCHEEFLTNLNLPASAVKAALQRVWTATEIRPHPCPSAISALVERKYSTAGWNWKC